MRVADERFEHGGRVWLVQRYEAPGYAPMFGLFCEDLPQPSLEEQQAAVAAWRAKDAGVGP